MPREITRPYVLGHFDLKEPLLENHGRDSHIWAWMGGMRDLLETLRGMRTNAPRICRTPSGDMRYLIRYTFPPNLELEPYHRLAVVHHIERIKEALEGRNATLRFFMSREFLPTRWSGTR
jgi:hypothetical protein